MKPALSPLRSHRAVASALAFALAGILASASCANPVDERVVLGTPDGALEAGAQEAPTFTNVDAAADATADLEIPAPPKTLACIGTECPWPYATCPSATGNDDYLCGVDLRNDPNNCGACGNVCPASTTFGLLNMTTRCVAGKCQRECNSVTSYFDYRDCNGDVNDGCEADAKNDLDNCGSCGNVCPPGTDHCVDGKCGCQPGMIYCGVALDGAKACKDPTTDNANCGGCGIKCTTPADAGAPPPNMEYGCVEAQCGQARCKSGFQDCDGVIDPNGCETNITDVNNCGGCGAKCAAGETCVVPKSGAPYCGCGTGETLCVNTADGAVCTDLSLDTKNCGACGNVCLGSSGGLNQGYPRCRQGFCSYDCEEGWADCDGNTVNGCETNLMVNTGNCGACGHRCDAAKGQPCIDGQCLMVECDGGVGEVTK